MLKNGPLGLKDLWMKRNHTQRTVVGLGERNTPHCVALLSLEICFASGAALIGFWRLGRRVEWIDSSMICLSCALAEENGSWCYGVVYVFILCVVLWPLPASQIPKAEERMGESILRAERRLPCNKLYLFFVRLRCGAVRFRCDCEE